LSELGAQVTGLALAPNTAPSLFELLELEARIPTTLADIADGASVESHLDRYRPEIVFHFAAQALVRESYDRPIETFRVNVMGTATLLEAIRGCDCVRAVVVATSDKCYQNEERENGYRESDPMGGRDPYSASKGAAELTVDAMRKSFFQPHAPRGHAAGVATVRSGNVIGGGDWSADRLVPDIVRSCLNGDRIVHIRNPNSIRPWQHVLEPLRGYLLLAERLAAEPSNYDEGWNFGPVNGEERSVMDLASTLATRLGATRVSVDINPQAVHEAKLLRLDATKARARLGWRPGLEFAETMSLVADWYGGWRSGADPVFLCRTQIEHYTQLVEARERRAVAGRLPT